MESAFRRLGQEAVSVALAEGVTPRGFNGFDPDAFRPGAPPEAALPTAPRGSLILLVDDEELVREVTAEGLRELGYEVVEVGTAANAIELVRRGLRPDALVTDHMMPGMLGADLAADLRARLPGLAVLMITGYANLPPERTRGIPVLSKPFRQAEIATALAELLDRRAPESNVVPWRSAPRAIGPIDALVRKLESMAERWSRIDA